MGRKAIGTVTTYEILLLLDPEQAEARQDEIVARTRELVEKGGGTWQSHDPWGRRRLAYPIAKKEEGVYHLFVFDAPAETLDEVSRVLKIDDAVLRHLATRHIAGSRTSAPPNDAPAPPPAAPVEREPAAPVESEPDAPEADAPEPDAPESDAPEADMPEPDVSAVEEPEYAPTDEEPAEVPGEEEE
jgi:small subunit ribosomal protein S6